MTCVPLERLQSFRRQELADAERRARRGVTSPSAGRAVRLLGRRSAPRVGVRPRGGAPTDILTASSASHAAARWAACGKGSGSVVAGASDADHAGVSAEANGDLDLAAPGRAPWSPSSAPGWLVSAARATMSRSRIASSGIVESRSRSASRAGRARRPSAEVAGPVRFRWTEVPEASLYRLVILGDDGRRLVERETAEIEIAIDVDALWNDEGGDTEPGREAYWLVEAQLPGGGRLHTDPRPIRLVLAPRAAP